MKSGRPSTRAAQAAETQPAVPRRKIGETKDDVFADLLMDFMNLDALEVWLHDDRAFKDRARRYYFRYKAAR